MSGATTNIRSAAPFSFRFIPAPEGLETCINTMFVFETALDRLEDVLPAYSAQLILFYRGAARMEFADGTIGRSSDAFILTPLLQAAPFSIEGPAAAIGISMTPLGLASFAGLAVDEYSDQVLEVDDALGGEAGSAIRMIASRIKCGETEPESGLDQLAELFRANLSPPPDDHALLIAQTAAWLNSDFNPDIETLLARVPQSRRTVQRLLKRYFGQPPSRIAKRYRAIRAATMLGTPDLPDSARAQILDSFFDQAHMIRDIRRYTGRTPKALAGDSTAVGKETLGEKGYGLVDLLVRSDE